MQNSNADLVLVTEYTTEQIPPRPQRSSRTRLTQMFHNGRERRESTIEAAGGNVPGNIVVIAQPDLRRELHLDIRAKTFTARPLLALATPEEIERFTKSGARSARQHRKRDEPETLFDVLIHIEKLDDTAEFFGIPARRYITRRRNVYPASPRKKEESVTDGRYLDPHPPAMPPTARNRGMGFVHAGNQRPVFHRSGESTLSGIPASAVATTRQATLNPGPPADPARRSRPRILLEADRQPGSPRGNDARRGALRDPAGFSRQTALPRSTALSDPPELLSTTAGRDIQALTVLASGFIRPYAALFKAGTRSCLAPLFRVCAL